MNFMNRGWIAIRRNFGKTVILFALIFIFGNLISGAISIRQSIHQTEDNIRASLPPLAFINQDWENYRLPWEDQGETLERESLPQMERLNLEVINQIGQLSYVRAYDLSLETHITGRGMVRYFNSDINLDELEDWITLEDLKASSGIIEVEGFENIWLKGVQNVSMVDMEEELISLYSGRLFTQEELDQGKHVGMVSRGFAEANGLEIGSIFTMEHAVFDFSNYSESEIWRMDWGQFIHRNLTKDITITGIFEVIREFDYVSNSSQAAWLEGNFQNRIYLPNSVVSKFSTFDFETQEEVRPGFHGGMSAEDMGLFTLFALTDSRYLGAFSEAASYLLPPGWRVNFMSNNFHKMTSSLATIRWIADTVLWTTVGGTISIIGLLMTLFLRDRKHEMGILLAIGERKSKIMAQLLMEVLSVAMIAMTLSIFSGNLLSSHLSRQILENQLQHEEEVAFYYGLTNPIPVEYDLGDLSLAQMLSMHDTSLTGATIALFFAVGSVTIIISTLISTTYVFRLNPKKILL